MIFNSVDIPKTINSVIRKKQISLWDQFTSHMLKVFLRSSGAQATNIISGPSSEPSSKPNAPYVL
jgi:hypothetical protein